MKEHILITVKTYPTLSNKYAETVCTAGIKEDGSWVRLYPVPFRRLKDYERYHKYQWLSTQLVSRTQDPRPESFSPDLDSIELGEVISTSDGWAERCRLVLENGTVYDDMAELIQLAKDNQLSLATYKPPEILDLVVEETEREWSDGKIKIMKNIHRQGDLFADDEQFETEFKLVSKLPYTFSYRLRDKDGTVRKLMILDWEIGALYWNCLKAAEGDEAVAIQKVREKYLDYFARTLDLHLFVGTTQQFHGWASNPFVIIGTFTPPKNRHLQLGLWN
jgi:hypothetical protein